MVCGALEETTVRLPGGLIEPDGLLSDVTLRPVAGRDEEWLARAPHLPNAHKVTRILTSCLADIDGRPITRELARKLLVGDRDYLMLALRRLTLGDKVLAVISCPACAKPMDVTFDISQVQVEDRPQTAASYSFESPEAGGRTRTVRFRLPNGEDQESVVNTDDESAAAKLLERCVLDDGGVPLSEVEAAAIADSMERAAPVVALELDLACPECDHQFSISFDTTSFFFEELRVSNDQLLREIHSLAFHYHWSEGDILALSRTRRRAYLRLLEEALRPE